ncbi:MAG: UDP-N-acetylmuramyl-tripeptide synthetase [Candidatus Paceibacterota bacterium]|jgi:UDP-N-acetylmuramoyl-L-alanyl-D-glutamate--2,6-diaminopimelate ligase
MRTNFFTKILKKIIPKDLKKNSFLRKVLALIANAYFGFPSHKLILLGVTGTTGKTTTTFMIKSILEEAGIKTGLIGTAGYYLDDEVIYDQGDQGPGTTPDPFFLHHLLKKMTKKKIRVVIIEVSSFGLMYWRTYGLRFQAAVLTNIAYNHHIVLHKGMENYIKEKLKFFRYLPKNSSAILPQESEYLNLFKKNTRAKVLTYGFNSNCDIWATGSTIHCQNKTFDLKLKIPASFNVLNALAAIGAVYKLQISEAQTKTGLEKIESIPGRLEMITRQAPFKIIIDKANTPLAFQNIIDYLNQSFKTKRKIVVYGTFNESPLEEREMLAKLTTDFFDLTIITEDDPKDELPQKGIEDFLNFAQKNAISENKYLTIVDRREAIKTAIEKAKANDLILVLGRGNEQFMLYKNKKIPFDDRVVTKEILKEAGYLL